MNAVAAGPQRRLRRRLGATAALAAAVALVCVASVAWPEYTGRNTLIDSSSAAQRGLGLALVVVAFPAVLLACAALSTIVRQLPGPWAARAVVCAGLWTGSAAFAVAWSVVAVFALVGYGLAERDAHAKRELDVMPGRIAAVAGVTGTPDARLIGTDLASGHNLFLAADLDPGLAAAERLAALARISAVLAEHQSNDLRMLVQARIGAVAVGVGADDRLNDYRLDLAERVSSVTDADLVVVSWRDQGDDLSNDDGAEVDLSVHSATQAPEQLAAAAGGAVRASGAHGVVTALRYPPGVGISPSDPAHARPWPSTLEQATVQVRSSP